MSLTGVAAKRVRSSEKIMEHEYWVYNDPDEDLEDDLLPEYDFGSMKAKFNPYAARAAEQQFESQEVRGIENPSLGEAPSG